MNKIKAMHSRWKRLETKANLSGRNALAAVEQGRYALRYVKEQSEKICLAAVEQDGCALQYVKEQSEKICLAAVEQNGYALQYVKEQIFF